MILDVIGPISHVYLRAGQILCFEAPVGLDVLFMDLNARLRLHDLVSDSTIISLILV